MAVVFAGFSICVASVGIQAAAVGPRHTGKHHAGHAGDHNACLP